MSEHNLPNVQTYKEAQAANGKEAAPARKVVQGTTRTKQKTELQKAAGSFFARDIREVGSYILTDVLLPGAKNTILEMVIGGLRMWINGEAGRSADRRGSGGYVDYRGSYKDRRDEPRRDEYSRSSGLNYEDIIFDYREDAERVIDEMGDYIRSYGFVRVSDVFEFAGMSSPSHTNTRYGWDSIQYARVGRTRDGGYFLDLPRPHPRN